MKFIRCINAKSACMAIALFGAASLASASEVRMHVPVTARWGSQILPSGDYTFELSAGSPVMKVSGNGKTVSVFVTEAEPERGSDRSYLKLVDVHGTPTVTALASGSQGVVFQLAVSKSASHAPATLQRTVHGE